MARTAARTAEAAPDLTRLRVLTGSSTLGDRLYDVLEEAIIAGVLQPGQRVHADDIAQHFGISRIPVRETLRALDAAGWIELRPRHGAYVRRRTAAELASLFEVRLVLEAEAARWAAERRTDEHLTDLGRFVDAGRAAVRAGDLEEVARLNTLFHNTVARAADNEVLASLLEGLAKRVRFYFATVTTTRARKSVSEHAALVDALRAHDGGTAARITREHIETTRSAVDAMLSRGRGGDLDG